MSNIMPEMEQLFAQLPRPQEGPLLKLPPEIRKMVYDFFLPAPATLHPNVKHRFRGDQWRKNE